MRLFWIGWGGFFAGMSLMSLYAGKHPVMDATCLVINLFCVYFWLKQS